MTNSKTMTEQEKKDQLWDQLIDLQEVLEMNETENERALEDIFFLLDDMRGGQDMTEWFIEEVETFLEINAK